MNRSYSVKRALLCFFLAVGCAALGVKTIAAQRTPQSGLTHTSEAMAAGPYAFRIAAGGPEVVKALPGLSAAIIRGEYSFSLWVRLSPDVTATTLLAGFGDPEGRSSCFLGLAVGNPILQGGNGTVIKANSPLSGAGWHLLVATIDGRKVGLFVDGAKAADGMVNPIVLQPELRVAPNFAVSVSAPDDNVRPRYDLPFEHFGGELAEVQVFSTALPADVIHPHNALTG